MDCNGKLPIRSILIVEGPPFFFHADRGNTGSGDRCHDLEARL